jgi:hypothetical protein
MNRKKEIWMLTSLLALVGFSGVPFAHAATTQDTPVPFVVTENVNINNFVFTPVPIPQGMRLVIDYVSLSGAAQSSGGPVQPIVILDTQVSGGSDNLFYFGPSQSGTVSGQYYMSQPAVIYADTLNVSPAFAGFTPSFLSFNVVISGHLIPLTAGPVANPLGGRSGEPIVLPGIVAPPLEPSGGLSKK